MTQWWGGLKDLLRPGRKPCADSPSVTPPAKQAESSGPPHSRDEASSAGHTLTSHEYDPLTGLPQTELFLHHLRSLMDSARRRRKATAVIEIGLSDIKRVNDTFGPRFADVLVRQSAFRLYSAVKQTDALARVGSLNFAVGLEPFDAVEDVINVAHRLLATLGETFSLIELSEHHVRLTANAGISIFPAHAESAEDLLYQASIALSQACVSGANQVQLFSPQRREESKIRLELEWKMRCALERQEFRLSYQPEIELQTGKTLRREALLRWSQPDGGQISPSHFVPIAEQTGLIIPLGNWVIDQACQTAQDWQRGGDRGVGVAVNVSSVQLTQSDFASEVERALKRSGLAGGLLEIELTESSLMADLSRSIAEISRLRRLGTTVVIDDFGVGYSSLSYLKELPVTGVKLDRSFLRDLQANPNVLPILRSIVTLAHNLKMRVTVEGVERADELDTIRSLGVDAAQGFLLGRPEAQPVGPQAARTAS